MISFMSISRKVCAAGFAAKRGVGVAVRSTMSGSSTVISSAASLALGAKDAVVQATHDVASGYQQAKHANVEFAELPTPLTSAEADELSVKPSSLACHAILKATELGT